MIIVGKHERPTHAAEGGVRPDALEGGWSEISPYKNRYGRTTVLDQ
jgi:hypothetical protein